jgi:hypothetical protein
MVMQEMTGDNTGQDGELIQVNLLSLLTSDRGWRMYLCPVLRGKARP